jgi:hypothetical protein
MHNTLRDAFTVKMTKFLQKVNVLYENWTTFSGREAVLIIPHWNSKSSS